ncbi:Penicillin-binding protein [gamma proteobacterium HdN1]|nr:Penicillin-binding protein [gamma proteobacterium HdN1]
MRPLMRLARSSASALARKATQKQEADKVSRSNSRHPQRTAAKKRRGPSSGRSRITLGDWITWLLLAMVPVIVFATFWLIQLDQTVVKKFEGKRWAVPAKVFARPLELYTGQQLGRDQITWELAGLGYNAISSGAPNPGEYRWSGNTLVVQTRGFDFWDGNEPSQRASVSLSGKLVENVDLSAGDTGLLRFEPRLIGGIYPAQNEDRILVSLSQVPPQLVQALIATEDHDFYDHFGLSPRGVMRALVNNIRNRGVQQGGSTITQQLVKNFYLTSERTLRRKATEAVMALLLERHATKDEILEAYLNEVYLGQAGKRAIHGVGLASLFYFGQPLAELRLDQMAFLVGTIRGPSYYDPRRNPERAIARRNQVLILMAEQGVISAEESKEAMARPLSVSPKPMYEDNRYPAFMHFVQRNLKKEYNDEDLRSEGLRIFTTLDPWIQEQLERSLAKRLGEIQKGYPRAPELEGAGVVTSAVTGEVVALLGGKNPKFQGLNRATDIARPIGSLVKPAVYLTAIEKGYLLAQHVEDISFSLPLSNGKSWQPSNFDHRDHGSVNLITALSKSYNIATAKIALDVGIDSVADTLERLGVSKPIPRVPALSLGVLELAPIEVAELYQTIAAQGFYTPLRGIRSVLTSEGKPLQRYPLEVDQRFKGADTYLLTRAMQQTFISGTAAGYAKRFPEMNLAGKTGTSNDQRDSWFAGFSGNYLGILWMGNDENKPTPLTGSSGALSAWAEMFSKVMLDPLQPVQPDDVRWDYFSSKDGSLTESNCEGALYLPARMDTLPDVRESCGLFDELRDQWSGADSTGTRPGNGEASGARKNDERPSGGWFNRLFGGQR